MIIEFKKLLHFFKCLGHVYTHLFSMKLCFTLSILLLVFSLKSVGNEMYKSYMYN